MKEYHAGEWTQEEQQAARDAVMEIDLFPDLTRELRKALGYGPHADMLQHLVYWFHDDKPKMRKRWTLYKTFAEWYEECGLSERQVKKGRARLSELGLVTFKRGQYSHVHYRVDWVALARILNLDTVAVGIDDFGFEAEEEFNHDTKASGFKSDTVGVQLDENEEDEEEFKSDTVGVQLQVRHQGVQFKSDTVGVRLNTREYAGDYEQENSPLQGAAEPAFAEPAAPEINEEKEPQEDELLSPLGIDKRHSQVLEAPKPKISKEVEGKVWGLIFGLPNETDVTRFADHHIQCNVDAYGEAFTVERVAEKAREHLGGHEPLEAYTPWVRRCLEDKRAELMGAAS